MSDLFDQVAFGVYLLALGREQDADSIFTPIVEVPFAENYNIWTPVGYGICLRARLLRLNDDAPAWRSLLERIREHPVEAFSASDLPARLTALADELDQGYHEKSLKWGCYRMAMALAVSCYYRECALAGIAHDAPYDVVTLESRMVGGLSRLRERLEAA
ncbi:MAG TPA: hypothetical protein VFS83_06865 [Ktedonobacterales bacterium]|nr:hypothetical protein [Ktedonobacterales bacterium]